MEARGPRIELLGGGLLAASLQELARDQQRLGARRLEDRIAVLEVLRMQDLVGLDLVVGVVAGLLRLPERRLGLSDEPGAEENGAEVELDDRIVRVAERELLQGLRARLR